jgi:hypothetical protein
MSDCFPSSGCEIRSESSASRYRPVSVAVETVATGYAIQAKLPLAWGTARAPAPALVMTRAGPSDPLSRWFITIPLRPASRSSLHVVRVGD